MASLEETQVAILQELKELNQKMSWLVEFFTSEPGYASEFVRVFEQFFPRR